MDKGMAKYVLTDKVILTGSTMTAFELLCFVMVCKGGNLAEIIFVGILLIGSFAACGHLAALASLDYEEGR